MFLATYARASPFEVDMFALFQVILSSCTIFILYYVYWTLASGRARRKLVEQLDCGPIKALPDWDPFLGLQTFFDVAKWMREHTYLQNVQKRFVTLRANTFLQNFIGVPVISTIEPENLKTVLSLDFKNWGLGQRRSRAFEPFVGPGIFSTDGREWSHSREMLRPNFVRSQVRDLAALEVHVRHLIDALPKNESTVDLQKHFFQLTMDTATELLFGESTNCLATKAGAANANRFAEAWTRCLAAANTRLRTGRIGWLLVPRTIAEDEKYVHGMTYLTLSFSINDMLHLCELSTLPALPLPKFTPFH